MKNLILIGILLMATAVASQAAVKATVKKVTGDATVVLPGSSKATPLTVGETLPTGSVITTGPGSEVMLSPFPGAGALIKEKSKVSIDHLSYKATGSTVQSRVSDLGLHKGTIAFAVSPGSESVTDFKIHAGGAVAAARGASGLLGVTISEGSFDVVINTGGGMTINLPDGTTITLVPGDILASENGPAIATLNAELQARKVSAGRHHRHHQVFHPTGLDELFIAEAENAIFELVKNGVSPTDAFNEMKDALQQLGITLTQDQINALQESGNQQNSTPPVQGVIDETTHN